MSIYTTNPLEEKLDLLKNIIQDCNVNFLIGSGLSVPFLGTLGKIEIWLSELDKKDISDELKLYIKTSLYRSYFDVAMKDNIDVKDFVMSEDKYISPLSDSLSKLNNTYKSYRDFLRVINQILYERRSNTVNKQVNLFTTNIDIFLEKVIEDLKLQFNDGFNGVFKKQFSLSNFKKSFYQKSLHYDNIAEIPVFNLLKIHGSVTWRLEQENIEFIGLNLLEEISKIITSINLLDIATLNKSNWIINKRDLTIDEIISEAQDKVPLPSIDKFIENYQKLQIVNPTKEKFRDTTFNKTYYEMLRLYANELEKENSVLFIMGFSLADEHIRDITIRAVKSNPTLKVIICSYTLGGQNILDNLNGIDLNDYHNIELMSPVDKFDLRKTNELLFHPILDRILLKK